MSQLTFVGGVALFSLLLCIIVLVMNRRQAQLSRQQQDSLSALKQQMDVQNKQHIYLKEAIHELRAGSLGVGAKVKELAELLQQTQARQEELEHADPNSRLYGKAAKLVAEGASIEEVMAECDLPRAEAELLANLHRP